ncbi:mitochondrial 54S ribosomal protein mL58 KNAG_0C06440 [Huiozyma naganishii CBS 8797]|uniref:Uncharacterized protein n=1 Tax=Huiozyma naganishii (strain ATCC MYA-139 / BCRC 22969 / CBS 8797 / KCTC 17520 / NBRC 10181 / NCYC 3082 / Yp74L-3) TaxID=1071383 RepID=J7RXD3_HUIN7|nr:hypothetical protein KNAG_0C06440 [Kazachstania naganishii CBS 8797]CCK69737.1 hypothetical protein KNAG_0C06440 [Kazachstania naganishii CBS 8797]
MAGSTGQRRDTDEDADKSPLRSGPCTIYNAQKSAWNPRGYLKYKWSPGVHFDPAPSSPTGSINSETIPRSFIPKSDPRAAQRGPPPSPLHTDVALAPRVLEGKRHEKSYHLTPSDVQRIQELRARDSAKHTRKRLANMFHVSPLFISMVSTAPAAQTLEMRTRLAQIQSNWSEGRTRARRDAHRRKQLWYRA